MSKILVIGKTRSGKTTVAQRLSSGSETHVFLPHSLWNTSNTTNYEILDEEALTALFRRRDKRYIVFEDLEKETTKNKFFKTFLQSGKNAKADVIVVAQRIQDVPPCHRCQFDGVYVCGNLDKTAEDQLDLKSIQPETYDAYSRYYNLRSSLETV